MTVLESAIILMLMNRLVIFSSDAQVKPLLITLYNYVYILYTYI